MICELVRQIGGKIMLRRSTIPPILYTCIYMLLNNYQKSTTMKKKIRETKRKKNEKHC